MVKRKQKIQSNWGFVTDCTFLQKFTYMCKNRTQQIQGTTAIVYVLLFPEFILYAISVLTNTTEPTKVEIQVQPVQTVQVQLLNQGYQESEYLTPGIITTAKADKLKFSL